MRVHKFLDKLGRLHQMLPPVQPNSPFSLATSWLRLNCFYLGLFSANAYPYFIQHLILFKFLVWHRLSLGLTRSRFDRCRSCLLGSQSRLVPVVPLLVLCFWFRSLSSLLAYTPYRYAFKIFVKQSSLLTTAWSGCNVCVYARATRMSDRQL